MRILFTQRKLVEFAGTEIVTLDLARSLKKRGHDIAVYCPRPGKISDLLAANGIATASRLKDVPWRPDFIHCHHHLPAIAALTAFPDTPALYTCHGVRPWVEHPPLHPQIQTYVAVSGKLAVYLSAKYSIPESRIQTVSNFVDVQRFNVVRSPSAQAPRKAVLFGQNLGAEEVKALDNACARSGIELDKIGPAYNQARSNPELILPDYDIAFAVGRSALEAMACGCAVVPLMPKLAGQIITSCNFDEWADKNFSPRFFTAANQVNDAWLAEQVSKFNPEDVAEVTEKVRNEFSLEQATDHFEALYKKFAGNTSHGDSREALVLHLEKLATEVDENWEALQGANAENTAKTDLIQFQTVAIRDAKHRIREILEKGLFKLGSEPASQNSIDLKNIIEASGLFDREWYLENNPDVAESGEDPLTHYLSHGILENRASSSDTSRLSLSNQSTDTLGISALEQLVLQMMIASPHIPRNSKAVN